jgi:threonylcarbamoyladenosine tRNA methylthiotransferase CDKAL1
MVLATDIICGFPTETDEEFEETLELVRRTRPTVINISRYTERPGTAAQKMKPVHGRITKDRSTKLTKLFQEIALAEHKKFVGKEIEILIDQKGKDSSSLGRDGNYRQIVIKKKIALGTRLKAKLTAAHIHYLEATVC